MLTHVLINDWGYNVRMASGFKEIFSECPFEGGYDCAIGTSENGGEVQPIKNRKRINYQAV